MIELNTTKVLLLAAIFLCFVPGKGEGFQDFQFDNEDLQVCYSIHLKYFEHLIIVFFFKDYLHRVQKLEFPKNANYAKSNLNFI